MLKLCSATADLSGHTRLCASGALSCGKCKECCTAHDSSVPGRPSHVDRKLRTSLGAG